MTKQKFLERWRKQCPELRVGFHDYSNGDAAVGLFLSKHPRLADFHTGVCKSADEAWARADELLYAQFSIARNIRLRQADQFMRQCTERMPRWAVKLSGALNDKHYWTAAGSCDHTDWLDAILEIGEAVEKAWKGEVNREA